MGTNYYLKIGACEYCGEPAKTLHIGKSSVGWKFVFKTYENKNIMSVDDWIKLIENKNNKIFDEYREEISAAEFIDLIDSKVNEKGRYSVDLGHWTDGKYDYLDYEFS